MSAKEVMLIGSGRAFGELAERLRASGSRVSVIAAVPEAKKRLGEQLPSLVVVDVETLPGGEALIRELTFLYRGMPVLAAAIKGSVLGVHEAIAAGAADYLLLPMDDQVLNGIVQRYADRYFDPELGRGRHMITGDAGMRRLLTQVQRVARSKATVLIQGESGTGKELIARYIHQSSERAEGPFVAVNCAALPENLLESELFGHVKGAFTGAISDRKGKFLQANGGTILLDEISEMTLNLQAKLLRVLQEGEVDPVGGRNPITLDVRVVASTNRNIKEFAQEGKFREDLYYRLNVFPVLMPALRSRPGDIPLLAEHFRRRFVQELGRNDIQFAPEALHAMRAYAWPGNVRELENTIQRALLVAEGDRILPGDLMLDLPEDLPPLPYAAPVPMDFGAGAGSAADGIQLPVGTTVREMEEILIRRTLDEVNGNRTRAAELLGISIRTLRNKLNEYEGRLPA